MGTGSGLTTRVIGEMSGTETVTLTVNQIPLHGHTPMAQSGNGALNTPQNGVWAGTVSSIYTTSTPNTLMRNGLIGPAGGSQPHENMMPYLAIKFIISLFGIFPTQN
jgi:microcystin-dependent protein